MEIPILPNGICLQMLFFPLLCLLCCSVTYSFHQAFFSRCHTQGQQHTPWNCHHRAVGDASRSIISIGALLVSPPQDPWRLGRSILHDSIVSTSYRYLYYKDRLFAPMFGPIWSNLHMVLCDFVSCHMQRSHLHPPQSLCDRKQLNQLTNPGQSHHPHHVSPHFSYLRSLTCQCMK